MLLVDAFPQLVLLDRGVPQPLQLPPLDVVQLAADAVVDKVQLVGDGAVADVVHLGVLQLLPELGVGLQDLGERKSCLSRSER